VAYEDKDRDALADEGRWLPVGTSALMGRRESMSLQLQDAVRPAARLMSMAGGLEMEQTLCADVRLGTGAWANSNRNVGAGTAEAQPQWDGFGNPRHAPAKRIFRRASGEPCRS
jgi:hypothetical protein